MDPMGMDEMENHFTSKRKAREGFVRKKILFIVKLPVNIHHIQKIQVQKAQKGSVAQFVSQSSV